MLRRTYESQRQARSGDEFYDRYLAKFNDDPSFMTCDSLDVPDIRRLNKLLDQAVQRALWLDGGGR